MKKLFFFATAALVLAGCNNDVTISENTALVGSNTQKEIAFSALNHTPKRAQGRRLPITDTTFPTTCDMQVAAYDAQNSVEIFGASTFTYDNTSELWHCATPKYWPLAEATINFLAYANFQGTAGSETAGATWGGATHEAAGVTLVMTDNSDAQKDLMYAVGQGKVSQSGNALVFPKKVDLAFTHAQALLMFKVKATEASAITLKKITLNNAYYGGTLTLTNTNYSSTGAQSISSAEWSSLTNQIDHLDIYEGTYVVPVSSTKIDSVMVVPNPSDVSFDSFTLTYRIAGIDKDYTYTYTPASCDLANATKYVYDITFTLHEILIDAKVTDWADGGTTDIDVPELLVIGNNAAFSQPASGATYVLMITGLSGSGTPTIDASGSANAFGAGPSATIPADGVTVVTYTLPANAANGASRTFSFTVTDNGGSGGSNETSTITITQAAGPDYVPEP